MGTPELPVPDGLVLRPFRAVRFAVADLAAVTSPPYDLIGRGDVERLLLSHPNNVVRLTLPFPAFGPDDPPAPVAASGPNGPAGSADPATDTKRPGDSPDPGDPFIPANAPTPGDTSTFGSAPRVDAAPGSTSTPGVDATPGSTSTPGLDAAPSSTGTLGSDASPGPAGAPGPADVRDSGEASDLVRVLSAGDEKYAEARDTLRAWLASGILVVDEHPALYVYEQSGPGVLQRGLIGDVFLAAPEQHIVLPHEDVMPGPVADRLALMSTTEANLEPIFLLYGGGGGPATALVEEVAATRTPLTDMRTDDGQRHRLWAITDPAEVDLVNAGLHDHQALIADGHHRYATYRALQRQEHTAHGTNGPWDFGLALLVDSTAYPPDLKAIHRVIPGLPPTQATARAKGSWQVHDFASLAEGLAALETAPEPSFLLTGEENGACHLLTTPDPLQLSHAMPADHSPRWNALNTAVLAEFVMPKVWGMRDDEWAVRIVHHDAHTATRLAIESGGTAVILNPLKVEEVLAVAALGERVPRKSTSFGPKPRTGLLLRTFAID
ncbi:DUF1015 family protein [Nonomuraea sp. NPDC046570]|uniref:DUF1015 family protein n=1 Tax=Nonomuraea sp. NPDC046570 TaxID=3155255 RepID=UPI0033E2830A